MAGTKDGGAKCYNTIITRYGDNYYKAMGRKGGLVCGTKKGFAANIELARQAGRKGGKISRRGKSHETRQDRD